MSTPKPAKRTFRSVFWQPPRAHGDVIVDRTVSYLELLYDLVYVVVIGRASFALARHVTWRGSGEFVVVFTMIWMAWFNGTVYQDLHGRGDGRSRFFVFVQMLILALLAVFTADAAGSSGRAFAIVYTVFLAVLTWLWYSVRRLDSPEYAAVAKPYLVGMIASVVAIGASAALPPGPRVVIWALFGLAWIVGGVVMQLRMDPSLSGFIAQASLIERFDLFVIIVLGEVVVGVVTGLSATSHDATAIVTGLLGLMIGFGFWWTYFDFVGRRPFRNDGPGRAGWLVGHLPVAMAITASGAAMVSLVEHAGADRAPEPTAWLLSASVAVGLLSLIVVINSLADRRTWTSVYDPLSVALVGAAAVALLVGWWRPAPWLLVTALVLILVVVWLIAVFRWLRLDDPDLALPAP
jgi:low temperature requirement protein LtrA